MAELVIEHVLACSSVRFRISGVSELTAALHVPTHLRRCEIPNPSVSEHGSVSSIYIS